MMRMAPPDHPFLQYSFLEPVVPVNLEVGVPSPRNPVIVSGETLAPRTNSIGFDFSALNRISSDAGHAGNDELATWLANPARQIREKDEVEEYN
jgi:hypothetical protein